MGRRDLLVGVVVVGAMVAAMYLTRQHQGTKQATGGRAGGETTVAPGMASPLAPGGLNVPNLSVADARLETDDVSVQVEAMARPILAFRQNRLLFRFEGIGNAAGQLVSVQAPTLSFAMEMDMGKHRYALVPAAREGWLQADVVLPACPSGGRRWYGDLSFRAGGRQLRTRFQFDLEPASD